MDEPRKSAYSSMILPPNVDEPIQTRRSSIKQPQNVDEFQKKSNKQIKYIHYETKTILRNTLYGRDHNPHRE